MYVFFFRLQDKFGCVFVLDSAQPFLPSLYLYVGDHYYRELKEVRFLLKNIVCATLWCVNLLLILLTLNQRELHSET